MRRYPGLVWPLTAMAVTALVGCASDKPAGTPATTTTAEVTPSTGPLEIGISPGGVTTSLSAPASSTEEEYFKACHAASVWMKERGGDPRAQIEPYLAMIQASQSGGEGTWNTPWAQLPQERQAAVIVAVQGAADGACG